jgi:pyruvate/2-oxoglutarate dehydrogenase complex dihydrolipoamide dehydrogenase (E3) component
MAKEYDVAVIGAGQGGTPLAFMFAGKGKKAALIERGKLGGSCVNYGCTPSKTMAASAKVAQQARRSDQFGVRTGNVEVDMVAVRERKREIVKEFRTGIQEAKEHKDNLDLVQGEATFKGPKTLEIKREDGSTEELTAGIIVVDTGAKPILPPVNGLNDVDYLDSTRLLELDEVPEHLLIVGAGYVGLEFAQMYRRFGADVTVVEGENRIAMSEDEDVSSELQSILEEEGIRFLLGVQVESVKNEPKGKVTAQLSNSESIEASHFALATGREPTTGALNTQAGGIETDEKGFIKVDDQLRTSAEGVYAIGDCREGGPLFTHISYDDFRILRTNLLGDGGATRANRPLAYTMFTDPQVGHVGLHEHEAQSQGIDYKLYKIPMEKIGRADEKDEDKGFLKAVVDKQDGKLLGLTCLGFQGGELAGAAQIAMMGGLTAEELKNAPFSHPTLVEGLNDLFSSGG